MDVIRGKDMRRLVGVVVLLKKKASRPVGTICSTLPSNRRIGSASSARVIMLEHGEGRVHRTIGMQSQRMTIVDEDR